MNQEFLTQLQQHLGRDPEDFITQQVAQGYPVLVFPPAEVPDFFQQKRELRNWTLTPVLNPEVRTREILALPKTNTARAVYKQGQPLRIQRITGCEPTWASRYESSTWYRPRYAGVCDQSCVLDLPAALGYSVLYDCRASPTPVR